MMFTQYDAERFKNDPLGVFEEFKQAINAGDTQLILAKEPVQDSYPKDEGIFFIYNKLLELENPSSENISNSLLDYTDFMKKHKIQIIKEFDTKCSLAYKGEIPHIKVESFETQPFYGFNKFHIINGETLNRNSKPDTISYIKGIDFTYALDSNAASFFARYCTNNNDSYKSLYNEIIADENNIDIAPYIFEIVMHGLRDFGINYKLNKKNKNETQVAFFYTLKVLHKEGLFKEKKEKVFINSIIKQTNRVIEYYGTFGFTAHIFLFSMLEARYKFGKSPNKIQDYVYSEMRKAKAPIENRLKAILYLFTENPGHSFFKKVKDIQDVKNLNKYMKEVDNTARDIALSLLEKYMYGKLDIYPFMATDDAGLIKMLQDTKPDYIFKYDVMEIPVHKKINKDMGKKHLKFFETSSPKNGVFFQDGSLKEVMDTYKNKKDNFMSLIMDKDK
ncbi:hypothetical protein DZA31_00795 [Arcobacter sp. HD9-500m-PIT-SAG02]|nr:hypothetical protein DZA31_00795 [Arcobacter sp. HD9-500m-PIT-SAG02]